MASFYVKPEKMDKIQKPMDENKYFQWKETVIDCASQKSEWLEFTSPSYKWIPRNVDKNRGFKPEKEEEKKKIIPLNSYINYIATYAPGSLVQDIINESNGNAYIDAKIRSMYQLKNTGSSVFKYFKKSRSFNHAGTQSFQDFYYELRALKYETLYKQGQQVSIKGKEVTKDESLTPSMENSIVIDWLAAIDGDLIEEVEQQYARDLESVSLVDLQEIISQSLPSLLNKIKTKKDIGAFKVKLEKDVAAFAVNSFGRRGNRGNGRGGYNRQRQEKKNKSKGGCSLCKAFGFDTRAQSHETKDCYSLKSIDKVEKGMLAMTINSTLDGSELIENNEDNSRPTGNDDITRPHGNSNDDDEVPWLNEEDSD